MRLIDADLLTEKVTKWLNPDPNADRMVDIDDIAASVLMEIEEQPTVPLWISVEDSQMCIRDRYRTEGIRKQETGGIRILTKEKTALQ